MLRHILLYLLVLCALIACDKGEEAGKLENTSISAAATFDNYKEKGDIDKIRKRKHLRLLVPYLHASQGLPREGLPREAYRELAEAFAQKLNVTPQFVVVDGFDQLIPALLEGRGDVIATHFTATDTRQRQVSFTKAIDHSVERIISPAKQPLTQMKQLNGKRFAVYGGSSFVDSLNTLKAGEAELGFSVETLAGYADADAIVDRIVAGEFDATVLDDSVADSLLQYRDDFVVGPAITERQPIAWAVRPNNPKLLKALDDFLLETRVNQARSSNSTDDFPAIKKRHRLRVITYNSPASYFVWRGELMGFEYELLHEFAKRHDLLLEIVAAPPEADILQWLIDGKGDVAAASLTITPEREARGVRFSRYYNKVSEQLVTGGKGAVVDTLDALQGRTLVVHEDTSYWQTAQQLKAQNDSINIQKAPDSISVEELLSEVAKGKYDATIADSHLVALEARFLEKLKPGLLLEPEGDHGWAVRQSNPKLLQALNSFLKKEYKGLFFNVTYNKYFKNEQRIQRYQGERLSSQDGLSPYDAMSLS